MLGRVFLGRYETTRLLGEGGMGRVYLARQVDLGRQVVVKVMHDHIAADPAFRERFLRETRAMIRFQHPYAVTLYDASLNETDPCIVMEYIHGEPLDLVLARNRRFDVNRIGRLVQQLCEVLYAAHQQGIIHRDLKPANLMIVDPDTPYELLKVMDFGLAKLVEPEPRIGVTNHEFAIGTPGYMCPEQARGEEIDHRGDLYSVGVILFELLTGQLPFSGGSTMDILLAHATEEVPAFSSLGAGVQVPAEIERVVMQCLAKDPAQRPQHARELADLYADALATHKAQQMLATTPGPTSPSGQGGLRPPREQPAWGRGPHDAARPPVSAASLAGGPSVASMPTSVVNVPAGPVEATPPSATHATIKSPTALTVLQDPLAIVHHIEAWMPETIARYKLSGFIQDVGGELIESVPGKIRVRLGGKGCVYVVPSRRLAWLGLGRRPLIDVELRLQRSDSGRDNHLKIMVIFRASDADTSADAAWREVCGQIFCDLRAYLMGQTGGGRPGGP
ncbi:MAG: protein kinase [Gemmataceae bacterium]